MPGPSVWGAALGMILVSTVFAYVLYFRLVERAGASNSLLVTFTIPIVAILLGVVVLGEALLPKHFIGMALIGLGLAAIDGRLFARSKDMPLPAWAAEIGATSWAQLFLRFALSHPAVTVVIPATGKPERQADNLKGGIGPLLSESQQAELIRMFA